MATAATGPTPGDATVVYIGKLPRDTTQEQVAALAAGVAAGAEVSVRRSYAYVKFATVEQANAAVSSLNGKTVGDREIVVELSKPAADRPPREPRERKPRAPRAAGAAAATGGAAASSEPRAVYPDRIVVRGLPDTFTAESLKTSFETIGPVKKASIRHRGPKVALGRVTFETEAAADRAVTLSGTAFGASTITVEKEYVRPKRASPRKAAAGEAGAAAAKPAAAAKAPAGERKPRAPKAAPAAGAAAAAPREARLPRRVRVDGLAAGTTREALSAHFASVGPVAASKVIRDRNHGFVTFENAGDVEKAVSLTGSTLSGAAISVAADVRRPRPAREGGAAAGGAATGGAAARAPREPREPRDVSNTLYLGNLNTATATVEALRAAAGAFGAVSNVDLIARGRAAYIKFATAEAVNAAAAGLNGTSPAIAFRPLRAEVASGPRPRTEGRSPRPAATA